MCTSRSSKPSVVKFSPNMPTEVLCRAALCAKTRSAPTGRHTPPCHSAVDGEVGLSIAFTFSVVTRTRPATGALKIDVRTVSPRQLISCGRRTLLIEASWSHRRG